jgi:hypothetical protein
VTNASARRLEAGPGEISANSGQQRAILLVDRTDPAEPQIVLPDGREPLWRNVPPSSHVLEERNHVARSLRSAEGHEQHRVVHTSNLFSRGMWAPLDSLANPLEQ